MPVGDNHLQCALAYCWYCTTSYVMCCCLVEFQFGACSKSQDIVAYYENISFEIIQLQYNINGTKLHTAQEGYRIL